MFLQANGPLAPGAEPLSGSLWPGGRVDLKVTKSESTTKKLYAIELLFSSVFVTPSLL
jgi:hypothetical protein